MDKMSWHKGKRELTEESTGDGKHGRKTRERLFKKRFSRLSLFSGSAKNKLSPKRSLSLVATLGTHS
ncbi:hypothetical protein IHE44_0001758 [Lamprotornis superbus]|uniref:Uncharacterized protein n=1 Tax=Lamprotornis superbus TaxID=245042 RepID=A0A835TUI3_9PASS|nr:hypothetical protein IHE44_0001758 [Lamprotornis superbus]